MPQPPGGRARKSKLRRRAETDTAKEVHIASRGRPSAIFAEPTFDERASTSPTLIEGAGCTSRMVYFASVSLPGAVCTMVEPESLPVSSASAMVNGFRVDPGSNRSVMTRLRS